MKTPSVPPAVNPLTLTLTLALALTLTLTLALAGQKNYIHIPLLFS